MTNRNNMIPIAGRLHSVAEGNIGMGANEIYDDAREVTQDVLNGAILEEKTYTLADYSGMGRVVLKKNIVDGVNTLTQDMFYKGAVGSRVPNTNTIYVIQYDYVLGEDITVPDNCVLEFDGGSINGYTLTLTNTEFAGDVSVGNILQGSLKNQVVYSKWFRNYVFENINSLISSGKHFIFENKEYICTEELKVIGVNAVTFDFCGATVYDRIDDYEPELSSATNFRYAPFIFVKGSNNVTIKNLTYIARVSSNTYQYESAAIFVGKEGYSIENRCSNILVENINFTDIEGSKAENFAGIVCLGDVENTIIKDISVSNGNYMEGINVEYGAKDTTDFGLTGKFPYNIHVINISGYNLPNMSNGLIRTGGSCNLLIDNVKCTDVLRPFNFFSGDDGSNSFEGKYLVNNTTIKYSEAFLDSVSVNNFSCVALSNVAYSNGTTGIPFDSYHQIINHFIFNNIEIDFEIVSSKYKGFGLFNIRGRVILNNLVLKNSYIASSIETSDVNDADGKLIKSWGMEINNSKIKTDFGVIVAGNVNNIIINNCDFSGRFIARSDTDTAFKTIINNSKITLKPGFTLFAKGNVNYSDIYAYLEGVEVDATNENCVVNIICKKCKNCTSSDGHIIEEYGTFAKKPTSGMGIDVGFRYFCTDKQTTEGATDGIEIFHKGNDVWVDALGRIVS